MKTHKDRGWAVVAIAVMFAALSSPGMSTAQTFNLLLQFDGSNGASPVAGLAQGLDGNLYGTTVRGGSTDYGTVFKITPSGALTTLYSFCALSGCIDGVGPEASVVLGTDGNFYGTTPSGGANGWGTVFKITPAGALTTLYSFCAKTNCDDGGSPESALVQASDGSFYGTTESGGGSVQYAGTVFKITPAGVLTSLYSFCALTSCADGESPFGALVQAPNGSLFGTTSLGGANQHGTVFEITTTGKLTTLYSFCARSNCADGSDPYGTLIRGLDGDFYGTTYYGGTNNYGTVFKITPTGALTTLYSFCGQANCADGAQPFAGLVQAIDGNFYGTTFEGGASGHGVIFKITSSGALTTLYSFCSQTDCADGAQPFASLVEDTSGTFYGAASGGGNKSSADGTLFSLSVGLGPFIEALPGVGVVGAPVKILGTGLTGTTRVTFGGVPAAFRVVSPSEIATMVPSGAKTGTVQAVTPGGTLSSIAPFRVNQ